MPAATRRRTPWSRTQVDGDAAERFSRILLGDRRRDAEVHVRREQRAALEVGVVVDAHAETPTTPTPTESFSLTG